MTEIQEGISDKVASEIEGVFSDRGRSIRLCLARQQETEETPDSKTKKTYEANTTHSLQKSIYVNVKFQGSWRTGFNTKPSCDTVRGFGDFYFDVT